MTNRLVAFGDLLRSGPIAVQDNIGEQYWVPYLLWPKFREVPQDVLVTDHRVLRFEYKNRADNDGHKLYEWDEGWGK